MTTALLARGRLASTLIYDSVLLTLSIPALIVVGAYLERYDAISFTTVLQIQQLVTGLIFGLGITLITVSVTYMIWLCRSQGASTIPAIILLGIALGHAFFRELVDPNVVTVNGSVIMMLLGSLWIFSRFRT